MQTIQEALAPVGAATVGLLVLILVLAALRRLLERQRLREGAPRFVSDLVLVSIAIVGMIMIILLLLIRLSRWTSAHHGQADLRRHLRRHVTLGTDAADPRRYSRGDASG